jgi:hypothetical protein
MDNEIRAALEQIILLDCKMCSRGTRLLRAVASEAEDALALLPAAGEPESAVQSDPSREVLLRADPSATVAFYPLPDGKLRLSCGAWEDSKVILSGELVEFRCERGQVVAYRVISAQEPARSHAA